MAFLTTRTELKKSALEDTQSTILSAVPTEKNLADRVDITPINYYIFNMKGINMKKTDKKYGITIDKRSKESAYITIKTLAGKWTIYVDNSTGEHIINSWQE